MRKEIARFFRSSSIDESCGQKSLTFKEAKKALLNPLCKEMDREDKISYLVGLYPFLSSEDAERVLTELERR